MFTEKEKHAIMMKITNNLNSTFDLKNILKIEFNLHWN